MPTKPSGSQKVLAGVRGPCTLDAAALKRFANALSEFRLVDWQCKGQPGPDFIAGSLDVGPGDVGRAAEFLVKAGDKLRINWDVFPNGIPFPDIYRINFRSGGPG